MSVERDSLCFHFWAHAWKTFDQYTRCLTCGQRMTPAKEDYTDHEVWGFPVDYVPQKTWRDLTGPYLHHSRAEANDEARSQLTDAEHDPRDF
jgi:hypothetical protein